MAEIVHITFEKLTGLKGTIEGYFIHQFGTVDLHAPLIYEGSGLFRQQESIIYLDPLEWTSNFDEHLKHGVNLLIKEWGNGRGAKRITVNNQSPN